MENLQMHHLKPKSKGGTDDHENIVYLCRTCHIRFTDYGNHRINTESDKPSHARVSKGPVASFYIGTYVYYWNKFKTIAKREGTSASKKIVEFIMDYVEKHDPGNPQTRIPSYVEGGKVTLAGIEGRVRQLCLERISKVGDMTVKEVRQIAKDEGVKGSQLKPFIERVTMWLGEQGKKVWR